MGTITEIAQQILEEEYRPSEFTEMLKDPVSFKKFQKALLDAAEEGGFVVEGDMLENEQVPEGIELPSGKTEIRTLSPGGRKALVDFLEEKLAAIDPEGKWGLPSRELLQRWARGANGASYEHAIQVCFACGLNDEDAAKFITAGNVSLRAFNPRSASETTYFLCLALGRTYAEARGIIEDYQREEFGPADKPGEEADAHTIVLANMLIESFNNGEIDSVEAIANYLKTNSGSFQGASQSVWNTYIACRAMLCFYYIGSYPQDYPEEALSWLTDVQNDLKQYKVDECLLKIIQNNASRSLKEILTAATMAAKKQECVDNNTMMIIRSCQDLISEMPQGWEAVDASKADCQLPSIIKCATSILEVSNLLINQIKLWHDLVKMKDVLKRVEEMPGMAYLTNKFKTHLNDPENESALELLQAAWLAFVDAFRTTHCPFRLVLGHNGKNPLLRSDDLVNTMRPHRTHTWTTGLREWSPNAARESTFPRRGPGEIRMRWFFYGFPWDTYISELDNWDGSRELSMPKARKAIVLFYFLSYSLRWMEHEDDPGSFGYDEFISEYDGLDDVLMDCQLARLYPADPCDLLVMKSIRAFDPKYGGGDYDPIEYFNRVVDKSFPEEGEEAGA